MINNIYINPSSEVPLFRQLEEQIKGQIVSGRLQAGDELPSVRLMAKHLGVNPMTISKAISQLTDDGWLVYQRGRPSQVASGINKSSNLQCDWLEPPLRDLIQRAKQLNLSCDDVQQQLIALWQKEK